MNVAPQTYVLDANLLVRLADISSPLHQMARNAIRSLLANGSILRTLPQSLFEFWVVATRSTAGNGLALTVSETENELSFFIHNFPVLADDPSLVLYWRRLVVKYNTVGKHAHDVRYVAAMQASGLTNLLTFDSDFNRYGAEGIAIVHPASVLSPNT